MFFSGLQGLSRRFETVSALGAACTPKKVPAASGDRITRQAGATISRIEAWVEIWMQLLESGFSSVLPVNRVFPRLSFLLNCLSGTRVRTQRKGHEKHMKFT